MCRFYFTPFINLFYHDSGFQQGTFATDPLSPVLALLHSLDPYSVSLLTSLSFTNRSREKDLWIFTGLVPDSLPVETAEPNTVVSNIMGSRLQTEANHAIDVPQRTTEPTEPKGASPELSVKPTPAPLRETVKSGFFRVQQWLNTATHHNG